MKLFLKFRSIEALEVGFLNQNFSVGELRFVAIVVKMERYDNRTATCNGHFSLARAAGLRKYVYANGFKIMDPISETTLLKKSINLADCKTFGLNHIS